MTRLGCVLLAAVVLLPAIAGAAEPPDGKPFSVQQHLDWKIAICYHPMYMLVDEDRTVPTVGERIPPWGAATAEQYLERVKRNLDSLERDPKLTLNYEWAAHSLDDIANRFPEVMKRMQAAHQRGQLDFVGGEYSLVHTQTYGSESDWRQFEEGHEVFRRLFNKKITIHAHQEPQLFHQLPQVLRHFGYEYAVLPSFPWAVTITQGPFELLGHESGAYLKKGDEFIRAAALDGTTVPAYFATNVRDRSTQDNGAMAKDLWGCPPIWIDFPDLEEYHNPNGWAMPALLGKALRERIKVAPPRADGTLHTYYSYVEGLGAEEHLRKNKAAEEAAVLAGNLLSMARLAGRPLDRQETLHSIWRTILKYQDHDATWLDAIDLRRKAIGKFEESILLSRKLMAEAAQRLVEEDAASLSVFNALPQARKALLDLPPQHLPAGIVFQQVGQRRLGFCELPAGGFRSFPKSEADGVPSREGPLPSTIVTDGYRVDLSREGLIGQLTTAEGRDLLAAGQYLGGEIRAVIDNRWASNRPAAVKFFDGEVCAVVERSGTFGGLAAAERPAPEAAWTKEGKSAGALKLNGTSYVAAGGLGSFEQLTVAMWVKPTASDNSHQALLHSDGWETSGLHFILLQDGRVQAAVNGAKPVDVHSLATPGKQLGKWTHLAVVYDGLARTLNLFVDGRKDNQITLTKSVPVVLDKFRLGAWDRGARFCHGLLRDVRVYRGVLDEAAIAGVARGANPANAKLAAWWKMDQTEGVQVADSSGEGHAATLVREDRGVPQHGIPLRERYYFFKHQPVIKAELEFDFDGAEVGDFHIDETKINVYYPTAGSEVHHDIPFGYVQARENESLLATNWVHCGGLAYVNRGTLKHWVRGGVVANTIAWGGDTWSNRIHYGFWMAKCKQSDLRLRGRQKIEYFLLPIGPFDGVKIVHAVDSLVAPTFVYPGRGEKSFYALADRRLATTALFEKDGQAWVRGYQLPGGPKGRWRDWEIFNTPWGEVAPDAQK